MKRFLFIPVFIFISFVSFSQDNEVKFPTDSSGNVVFTEVVKGLDSLSANELYSRAKIFVAKTFVSNKAVTELNDESSKTILIKPYIHNLYKTALIGIQECGNTGYTLFIECKDNKYRYTFSEFYHKGYGEKRDGGDISKVETSGYPNRLWTDIRRQCFVHVTGMITNLKLAMLKKTDDF